MAADRKLRILQVVPNYFPAVRYGGPIVSVHELSKALVNRGHEVQVFTSSMDGPNDLVDYENRQVLLDGVAVRYFRVPSLRRLCWCPAMKTALREELPDFDVVHLNSVFLWPTWAAAREAKAAGVPFILSPRGMLGHEVIRRKSRWVKTAWIRLIERQTLREAAAIHVTAELEAEELRALGLPAPNVTCIPNGVSAPPGPAGLNQGPFAGLPQPYALFLSRISWKKGLDRLIRAWKLVPGLTLIIAGNDEENYVPQLLALAEREGVSDRVQFVGPASNEDKWALYANAAMFILPSYSENFGNVVAEAMIMACPVIVTPEVGLADFVRRHGAGLVAEGEPASLAAAINGLNGDSALRSRYGAAGRRAAQQSLTWNAVAGQIAQLYEAVAAGA
jgi:glycosyltransferase involved in cell wall biosynthesis